MSQQTKEKPWGQETTFTQSNLPYVGKILSVKAGARTSLQYHDQKDETLCLVSGNAILWMGSDIKEKTALEKIQMVKGLGYHLPPLVLHRVEALEDSTIVESSKPETGITFRLDDDYGRTDEKLS